MTGKAGGTGRRTEPTLAVPMSASPVEQSPLRDDAPRSLASVACALAARVRSFVGHVAEDRVGAGRIVRFEAAFDPVDLLALLRTLPVGSRRYFRDRSAKFEVAGLGVATHGPLGAHEKLVLDPACVACREPVWFVAMPFDSARERANEWRMFAHASCVLPTIEVRREGELHTLAVNIVEGVDLARIERELGSFAKPLQPRVVEPALLRESDGDGEAQWSRAVRTGLERIRAGALRKIVLARTRCYAASGELDPTAVLTRLASRELRGFRFLVEVGPGQAFLGVTPERLVSRSGRTARSEAVAGTRPRGVDGVADRLLGESLISSAKDRREQALVVERVREALTACATSLRIDAEPRLLRLAYVQHLATRIVADLRPDVSDVDLVRALHPTPAVAGAPVMQAIEALRAFEPFDRGLYAGPVGVVSRDGAEIAVAIRSALISGDRLTAFAGAGIVEGSDPAEEWRETGHKLLAFERLAT